MPFAEVAVSSPRPHRQTFTYAIPKGLDVRVGHGVFVPFGRPLLQGVVLALADASPVAAPRPISALIDAERLLTPAQAALARWIAETYLAPIFSAVALFLPPGFGRKPQRRFQPVALADAAALGGLSERERLVLDAVTARRSVEADGLAKALRIGKLGPTLRALVRKNLLEERYTLARPSVAAKTEAVLALAVGEAAARTAVAAWPRSRRSRQADLLERLQVGPAAWEEARRIAGSRAALERWLQDARLVRSEGECVRLTIDSAGADASVAVLRRSAAERRQVGLLEALLTGPLSEPAARRQSGAGKADIEALIEAGLLNRRSRRVERGVLEHDDQPPAEASALTADQAAAYCHLVAALDQARAARQQGRSVGQVFLLQGVTGSGKTEVYLAASAYVRDHGGHTLALVPEISLTPQTVTRFQARFPKRVALLHSGLSPGQLYDQWQRIRAGEADVVIGSRSALFAPQPRRPAGAAAAAAAPPGPALIVLDEEHEWTYKQTDPAPRYHVREVAEQYARLTGAVVVLGSATPDIVTHQRASTGRYRSLELAQRVHRTDAADPTSPLRSAPLPAVEIVDMREELLGGNRSVFSAALRAALTTALAAGEQVILFLNRRGAAVFVCRTCGEARNCDRCSVPLTYHQRDHLLRCHECGLTAPPDPSCPACGSDRIRPMGMGTERLEEEVQRAFPLSRPLRWDRDTVAGKDGHRRLLERFIRGEANVLVGTQMIAKGLDLPAVTLVGVVNADLALRLPDYTGPERTFQLITQVAGRAGRGPLGGHVIVQTYAPDHYAISAAAAHDYDSFFEAELRARAQHDYPPFGRLARLIYADRKADRARDVATAMAASLREDRDRRGLPGPEVLGPTPAYIARRRGLYRWQITLRGSDSLPLLRPIEFGRGWAVDIDPVSLL